WNRSSGVEDLVNVDAAGNLLPSGGTGAVPSGNGLFVFFPSGSLLYRRDPDANVTLQAGFAASNVHSSMDGRYIAFTGGGCSGVGFYDWALQTQTCVAGLSLTSL